MQDKISIHIFIQIKMGLVDMVKDLANSTEIFKVEHLQELQEQVELEAKTL
jgi:hypothetical protein